MGQRHENRRNRVRVIYYYYYNYFYHYYYYLKKAYWKRSKLQIKFITNFDRFTSKVCKVVCKVRPLLKLYFLRKIVHTNFIFVKYSLLDVAKPSHKIISRFCLRKMLNYDFNRWRHQNGFLKFYGNLTLSESGKIVSFWNFFTFQLTLNDLTVRKKKSVTVQRFTG